MFQPRENHVLKVATIQGKNMLPIGSIFFPLKVAPMRMDNNFAKLPKLNYDNRGQKFHTSARNYE